ncbi:UNVERIFIED_CONTAM: DnaD domain protein [Campylobacter lari]
MLKTLTYPYFKVEINEHINSEDFKNLRRFYTPLLGSNAIVLYEYLRDYALADNNEVGFYDFDSLTYLLGMEISELNRARIMLESVSLITTYIDNMNRKTIFIVEKPLDRNGLRKNAFLANKLIKIMGKVNFDNLLGRERNLFLSKAKLLLDASAKFEDVFETDLEDNPYETLALEIDTRNHETKEINTYIQEKIEFDEFSYSNVYEAILKVDSRVFYSQLTNLVPTFDINNLIKEARANNFNDACINLVFYFAYETNNKINYKYVKKIIYDFINKGINHFQSIEEYLDNVSLTKSKSFINKKQLFKAVYIESLNANN